MRSNFLGLNDFFASFLDQAKNEGNYIFSIFSLLLDRDRAFRKGTVYLFSEGARLAPGKEKTSLARDFGCAKPVLKPGVVLCTPEFPSFYSPILPQEQEY